MISINDKDINIIGEFVVWFWIVALAVVLVEFPEVDELFEEVLLLFDVVLDGKPSKIANIPENIVWHLAVPFACKLSNNNPVAVYHAWYYVL